MANAITTVALAGATGNLGPAILDALLNAGFQVTVLSRKESNHTLPPSVKVAHVDYDSLDSLTAALQGQDAVVSTLASLALGKQLLLVDAAARAGVKRFLPSEFGSNTTHPKTSRFPCYGDKVAVQKALEKSGMTWTLVNNGAFLDWGIKVGFVMNVRDKRINLYDGGDRPFSTTTLATVGRAVVGVLRHPRETENRVVFVHDTAITPKKLAAMGKKATGGAEGWKEEVVSTDDLLQSAWAEVQTPGSNPESWVMKFITASIWGADFGGHFLQTDNELLGIKEMTDDEVQAVVNRYA